MRIAFPAPRLSRFTLFILAFSRSVLLHGDMSASDHRFLRWLPPALTAAIMAAFAGCWTSYLLRAHENFYTFGNLALFENLIRNLLAGRFFDTTLPPHPYPHLSPALAIFAPLYALGRGPATLLAARVVFIAASIPLVYALGRKIFGDRRLALLGAILTALNPVVVKATLDNHFNPEGLLIPLYLGALWALMNRRTAWFVAAGAGACLVKEDAALTVAFLGLYAALFTESRRVGAMVAAGAAAYFILAVLVFIPWQTGGQSYHPSAESGFAYLGDNLGEMIRTLLMHPGTAAGQVFAWAKLKYVFCLLLAYGFLPLAAPRLWLCLAPALFINLVSDNPAQFAVFSLYSAPLAPILLVAALVGAKRLAGKTPHPTAAASLILSAAILVAVVFIFALPNPENRADEAHVRASREMLAHIPPDAAVAASQNFLPHLADRPAVYDLLEYHRAEYILLDNSPKHWIAAWMNDRPDYREVRRAIATDARLRLIAEADGISVYRQKSSIGKKTIEPSA